jgi:formylmethanofuran dehydrogenase subunit E
MKIISTSKDREWSEALYGRAVEFHGHGGPYMLIGLRMGMLALRGLDAKGWFDIRCRAKLHWGPPDACVLDGIQISTGCTMGKHNLDVEEAGGVEAEFMAGEHVLNIRVKDQVIVAIRDELREDHDESEEENEAELEEFMLRLRKAPDDELFMVVHR